MNADTEKISAQMLRGSNAIIAGGTGNVGRHLVKAFLSAGATVVVPSRSDKKIDELRSHLSSAPGDRLITLRGNLGDETEGARIRDEIVERVGAVDAVVASMGRFVPAPSVLETPLEDLRDVLDGYLIAHFLVAKALIPALKESGSSYTFINGPLAFDPLFPGSGLISIATAAQAMLARVVMKEVDPAAIRVNELVLYTSFGWSEDEKRESGGVSREAVGRYAAYLASPRGKGIGGQTVHLNSMEPFDALGEEA